MISGPKAITPAAIYHNDRVRKIVESLIKGFNGESFSGMANYLLTGTPVADPYMCMADFDSYSTAQKKMKAIYADDKMRWLKMSLNKYCGIRLFFCGQKHQRVRRQYLEPQIA